MHAFAGTAVPNFMGDVSDFLVGTEREASVELQRCRHLGNDLRSVVDAPPSPRFALIRHHDLVVSGQSHLFPPTLRGCPDEVIFTLESLTVAPNNNVGAQPESGIPSGTEIRQGLRPREQRRGLLPRFP